LSQAWGLDRVLEAHGAIPLSFPCIAIGPPADVSALDGAIERLGAGEFDWVVLTSVNTVEAVAGRLAQLHLDDTVRHRLCRGALLGLPGSAPHMAGGTPHDSRPDPTPRHPELSGVAAAIAQVPMADGLAAARGIAPRQSLRLAVHGLRDELRGLLGRQPHKVRTTGAPGELALLTTADAGAGLHALNPDGHPWPNEIAARFALHAPFYRPVRHASAIKCPLLVVVCDADTITPPAAAVRAAERAPSGELLRVSGGHYAVYEGNGFEQTVTGELTFLDRHLPVNGSSVAGPSKQAERQEL